MVWSEEGRRLSERLQVMADKVEAGQSVADIGADHGYLGLYLYDRSISPRAVLTDISEASLAKAKTAAGAAQFGSDVDFRVGDGLTVLDPGEVDVVVIAGMGGLLIRDILSADPDKTRSFGKYVLQPRTASGPLRKWLLEADFAFLSEDIVEEGEFLPEIITVAPCRESEGDLAAGARETLADIDEDEDSIHFSVPVWMLSASGPVAEFLDRKIGRQEEVLAGLKRARIPDETAIDDAEYSLNYLKHLKEIRLLIEEET